MGMKDDPLECREAVWRGRRACVLSNKVVQLTHLTGGGQIPEFRFRVTPESNPFWIPKWKLGEPNQFRPERDAARFGPRTAGKLLSVIAGHSLCLGVFGMPSDEELRAGAVLHGEAGVRPWKAERSTSADGAEIHFEVRLPRGGLVFRRTLSLARNESVVRVHETVTNLFSINQYIQWQQHATLAPPFLNREESSVTIPGKRGVTDPNGYEGYELLAKGAEFDWPNAPAARGGTVDLRQPFSAPGTGFVAGVQIDPRRDLGFVCAVNRKQRVAFGYVFARKDFPWVAIWEENLARPVAPWKRQERARAFEFGVSPLPLGREETLRRGPLFETPTMLRLPAKGVVSASYAMFLARLPPGVQRVSDVVCRDTSIDLMAETGELLRSVAARGIRGLRSVEG
jgi:hypothetical protein